MALGQAGAGVAFVSGAVEDSRVKLRLFVEIPVAFVEVVMPLVEEPVDTDDDPLAVAFNGNSVVAPVIVAWDVVLVAKRLLAYCESGHPSESASHGLTVQHPVKQLAQT